MAGKYQLNTKGADGLEAHYLQELTRAKEEMQPLQERYDQLYGEILEDLRADIAQVGREAGLTVIFDKNQADIQAVDITNQVLDILQGEA
jgi:Skp family chaperone for outer membrane proteins